MLLKFTIENFEVFQKPVELSMEANLHTRKFLSNVIQSSQGNALKHWPYMGRITQVKPAPLKLL